MGCYITAIYIYNCLQTEPYEENILFIKQSILIYRCEFTGQAVVYSDYAHAPPRRVSVNGRAHMWWWSRKITAELKIPVT